MHTGPIKARNVDDEEKSTRSVLLRARQTVSKKRIEEADDCRFLEDQLKRDERVSHNE
jgi:hypothetical protein